MPRRTQHDLLAAALLARGYVRDPRERTTRYQTFVPTPAARSLLKPGHRVYLGARSLRYSTHGTVATSVPFSESTRRKLLAEMAP